MQHCRPLFADWSAVKIAHKRLLSSVLLQKFVKISVTGLSHKTTPPCSLPAFNPQTAQQSYPKVIISIRHRCERWIILTTGSRFEGFLHRVSCCSVKQREGSLKKIDDTLTPCSRRQSPKGQTHSSQSGSGSPSSPSYRRTPRSRQRHRRSVRVSHRCRLEKEKKHVSTSFTVITQHHFHTRREEEEWCHYGAIIANEECID